MFLTQRDSRSHLFFWAHNDKWVVVSILFLGIDRVLQQASWANWAKTPPEQKDSRGHDSSCLMIAQTPKLKYEWQRCGACTWSAKNMMINLSILYHIISAYYISAYHDSPIDHTSEPFVVVLLKSTISVPQMALLEPASLITVGAAEWQTTTDHHESMGMGQN